jgi:hypothetical protein
MGTVRAGVGLSGGGAWPSPARTRLAGGDDTRAPAVSDRGRDSGGGAGRRRKRAVRPTGPLGYIGLQRLLARVGLLRPAAAAGLD